MLQPHSRTLSIVRFLREVAPAMHRRKGGRMPRQQQPDRIREEYFAALMGPIRAQTNILKAAGQEALRLLVQERIAQGKTDSDRGREADEIIAQAGKKSQAAFRASLVHQLAEQFGERTSRFQHEQLDKQVRQAMGVPLSTIEKPIRDLITPFSKANVELVKSVPERYHDRLAKDVRQAFEGGEHPATLADRLVEFDDMSENDARRIARDQIGQLQADFNAERQQSLGVTSYIWRGAKDARERNNHWELEGQKCEWDDPPVGGGTDKDEPGNPGDGIMCRCFAEPDLSDILNNL